MCVCVFVCILGVISECVCHDGSWAGADVKWDISLFAPLHFFFKGEV